jgi:hypothetical protein
MVIFCARYLCNNTHPRRSRLAGDGVVTVNKDGEYEIEIAGKPTPTWQISGIKKAPRRVLFLSLEA